MTTIAVGSHGFFQRTVGYQWETSKSLYLPETLRTNRTVMQVSTVPPMSTRWQYNASLLEADARLGDKICDANLQKTMKCMHSINVVLF